MKGRTVALIVIASLIADQVLKIWVKTNMLYGEQIYVFGRWFRLFFIENEGMAWGWKFGGGWGKLALTIFRLVAVIFGVFYIRSIIRELYHKGFITCVALIFAGALGNLIDSMFYGLIFTGSEYGASMATLFPKGGGYAGFLHGRVVDMFYVPIIEDKTLPEWLPIWGGDQFTFFAPIFNLADASISAGVITLLLFQKKFFNKQPGSESPSIETNTSVKDKVQVL